MTTYIVREGVTEPIVFALEKKVDGEWVPFDLTGATAVVLHLTSQKVGVDNKSFSLDDKLAVTDAAAGEVTLSQDDDDLLFGESHYSAYFRITLGGKDVDVPSDKRFAIRVLEQN